MLRVAFRDLPALLLLLLLAADLSTSSSGSTPSSLHASLLLGVSFLTKLSVNIVSSVSKFLSAATFNGVRWAPFAACALLAED